MENTIVKGGDALIRGTTPTLEFTYSDITVSDIVKALLVIKQDKRTMIEKDIGTATVSENSIAWTLAQEDTLLLREQRDAFIMCDWKLADGTRGRSKVLVVDVEDPGKSEVI